MSSLYDQNCKTWSLKWYELKHAHWSEMHLQDAKGVSDMIFHLYRFCCYLCTCVNEFL